MVLINENNIFSISRLENPKSQEPLQGEDSAIGYLLNFSDFRTSKAPQQIIIASYFRTHQNFGHIHENLVFQRDPFPFVKS